MQIQTVEEALIHLQNLTNAKITQEEFGKALGTGRANISQRIKNKSKLTLEEIRKLEKYFNIEFVEVHALRIDEVNKLHTIKNCIEINYWDGLPKQYRIPDFDSVIAEERVIKTHWYINPQDLRIVPMIGDKMMNYWYKINPSDILIIDTSYNDIRGNGVYFATNRNNTCFWIREMQKLINDDIQIKGFAPPGETVKVFTQEQLQKVDFKIIGKVIKNVSFRL